MFSRDVVVTSRDRETSGPDGQEEVLSCAVGPDGSTLQAALDLRVHPGDGRGCAQVEYKFVTHAASTRQFEAGATRSPIDPASLLRRRCRMGSRSTWRAGRPSPTSGCRASNAASVGRRVWGSGQRSQHFHLSQVAEVGTRDESIGEHFNHLDHVDVGLGPRRAYVAFLAPLGDPLEDPLSGPAVESFRRDPQPVECVDGCVHVKELDVGASVVVRGCFDARSRGAVSGESDDLTSRVDHPGGVAGAAGPPACGVSVRTVAAAFRAPHDFTSTARVPLGAARSTSTRETILLPYSIERAASMASSSLIAENSEQPPEGSVDVISRYRFMEETLPLVSRKCRSVVILFWVKVEIG